MDDANERISDPRQIRALAHPLRIELIDVLGDSPNGFTATECAARTGESVASCSFHLRTLAKYGFVEPGERRGREKPWRLVHRGYDIRPDFADPVGVRAAAESAAFHAEQQFSRIRDWISNATHDEPEWLNASTITTSAVWMTLDELAELSRSLQHIVDHVSGRNDDPSRRPRGARPVRVFSFAGVDVARERRDAGSAS